MNDVKKLLARIVSARDAISRKEEQTSLDFMIDGVLMNCAVMLKEQEAVIEKLNRFVNGFSRDAMPVVRCKECKHGEKANDVYLCGKSRGFGLAHEPSWFCADGERKED